MDVVVFGLFVPACRPLVCFCLLRIDVSVFAFDILRWTSVWFCDKRADALMGSFRYVITLYQ